MIEKVDESLLKDHDDDYVDNVNQDFSKKMSSGYFSKEMSNNATDKTIEYTVLVAYTKEFADKMVTVSKIKAYMNLLEEETNTGYKNSYVNLKVKIVHYYLTSF